MATAASETSGLLSSPRSETSRTTTPDQKYFKSLFLPDVMANIFSFLEEDDENTQLFFLILVRSPNYRASFCGPGAGALYPELSKQDIRFVLLHAKRYSDKPINALQKIIDAHSPGETLALARYNPFVTRLFTRLKFDVRKYLSISFKAHEHKNTHRLLRELHWKQQNYWKKHSLSIESQISRFLFYLVQSLIIITGLLVAATIIEPFFTNSKTSYLRDATICAMLIMSFLLMTTIVYHHRTHPRGKTYGEHIEDDFREYFKNLNENREKITLLLSDSQIHKISSRESEVILDYIQQPILFQMPKRRNPAETTAAAAVAVHIP